MYKQYIALVGLVMLFCFSCNEHTKTIIPFKFVRRLPDKLEYYAYSMDSNDKQILRSVLQDHNAEYYTDKEGNFYIDASTNFGDGAQTYFWVITDDFVAAKERIGGIPEKENSN